MSKITTKPGTTVKPKVGDTPGKGGGSDKGNSIPKYTDPPPPPPPPPAKKS